MLLSVLTQVVYVFLIKLKISHNFHVILIWTVCVECATDEAFVPSGRNML